MFSSSNDKNTNISKRILLFEPQNTNERRIISHSQKGKVENGKITFKWQNKKNYIEKWFFKKIKK